MKFMWAVVAVLVIMAVVVTLVSTIGNCSDDDDEESAISGSGYEATYEQEPACADSGYILI
ncbi:MAG: hypothetical protein LUD50_06185 [Clostridia bacterium]|nr:hypothetical protein [Clostridia bacterium]